MTESVPTTPAKDLLTWAGCYDVPGDIFEKVRAAWPTTTTAKSARATSSTAASRCPPTSRSVMLDPYTHESREMIMLGSNSYLGLTTHPRVVAAVIEAARRSTATVRAPCPSTPARPTCTRSWRPAWPGSPRRGRIYLPHRLRRQRRHASRRCSAAGRGHQRPVQPRLDLRRMQALRRQIHTLRARPHEAPGARAEDRLRVRPRHAWSSPTASSPMEGDLARLDEIVPLARKYGAAVMLDDSATALGVMGKTGRGTAEHFGLNGQLDIVIGTLSKCLGGIGGVRRRQRRRWSTTCDSTGRRTSSPACPPRSSPGAAGGPGRHPVRARSFRKPLANVRHMNEGLEAMGFDIGNTQSAIIPVVVGNEPKLKDFLKDLLDAGIFMNYVAFPAVAEKPLPPPHEHDGRPHPRRPGLRPQDDGRTPEEATRSFRTGSQETCNWIRQGNDARRPSPILPGKACSGFCLSALFAGQRAHVSNSAQHNRRVLVTGSAGFIGSACAREFLRRGWNVVGLTHRSEPRALPGRYLRSCIAGRCGAAS